MKTYGINSFAMDGKSNILHENDFGIINGRITSGITYSDIFSVSGLWAPPYVSSDFLFSMRILGEKVTTTNYKWLPFECFREGSICGIDIYSSTTLVNAKRALIIKFGFKNNAPEAKKVPVQINIKGGMDYVHMWDFPRAAGTKTTDLLIEDKRIIKCNNGKAIIIGTDMESLKWHGMTSEWCTDVFIPAHSVMTYYFVISIGDRKEASNECESVLKSPDQFIADAHDAFQSTVSEMFDKLPVFEASDDKLAGFYYRSLLHYITNRWTVPQFLLNPCYTTGSIKGGCLASYLWDYSEGWELHPLFDPEATKEHIKQYLKIDITNCFSFDPMTGIAIGPWYPINQEKIIGLIYYYVLNTGDAAFLDEIVGGKAVWEWVSYHAMFGDDLDSSVALYDYSIDGEQHLELRKGFPYHGVIPDLNGRRYQNYIWAYELLNFLGKPKGIFIERAEALKRLLKDELWDSDERWFHFKTNGRKKLRYTVQMFKLINSGVLDREQLEGLLDHLNEEEFLSPYGMHSISKQDPAYDQVDIDNGGGGSCTVFPPQIAERLYKAGYENYAEDILQRILWWGERTPYWGDSFVANCIDYRSDTPLQCSIGGVTGAQCIIFGMFGVQVRFNGDIEINPHPPVFSPEITLKGLKIRGCSMDIYVCGNIFNIKVDDVFAQSEVGTPVIYDSVNRRFKSPDV